MPLLLRRIALIVMASLVGEMAPLGAQRPVIVVIVDVTDSTAEPLPGVTLMMLDRHSQALDMGTTNATGRYTFMLATDSAGMRLFARKLGYVETRRLVPRSVNGRATITFSMTRLPRTLDTVRTESRILSDDYFLDSVAIANEARNPAVEDVYDVLRRLRPGMLGDNTRGCADIQFVWINGIRYRLDETLSIPPVDVLRDPHTMVRRFHLEPFDLLAGIHPKDIASMQYRPCRDTSMPGVGAENALYITLKPGIAFDRVRGTFPADSVDSPDTPRG